MSSQAIVNFVRDIYNTDKPIYLHEPLFTGREKEYLIDVIDSTFVSSVGAYVNKMENDFASFVDQDQAVVCVNGTAALHMGLILAGVEQNDEVITQPLTFVATCNAIRYQGAYPVFVDVGRKTLGMSPDALRTFLREKTEHRNGACYNKHTQRRLKAVVPMHTFGHACAIDELAEICQEYNLALIEDAAEALGSQYKGRHLGTFGDIGAYSFNGNKIMTTGGGGMIVAKDHAIIEKAKHLTTTAKKPHAYEYEHDEIGYNYRMPNLNAALGCAQLEQMPFFLEYKRNLASQYREFFKSQAETFVDQPEHGYSNFWLNAIIVKDRAERDQILQDTNEQNVMTRPIWTLMNRLSMYKGCYYGDLTNAEWLEDRVINLPSSVKV